MQGNNSNLETYRFVFLSYLDVAGELVELENGFRHCMKFAELLENGASFDKRDQILYQEYIASSAGSFLERKFNFHNYSRSEFDSCMLQLRSKINVMKISEGFFWERLKGSVCEVTEWTDNKAESWLSNNAAKHHVLLRKDRLSEERIWYYKKELGRLETKPLSPSLLEAGFRCCHGGLIHLVPITDN